MGKPGIKPGPVALFFHQHNTTLWQAAKSCSVCVQSMAAYMRGDRYRLGKAKVPMLLAHLESASGGRWPMQRLTAVRVKLRAHYDAKENPA